MYGKEEVVKSRSHIPLVERFYGIMVLLVCLGLGERRLDDIHVVVVSGKVDNLWSDEYVTSFYSITEADAFQTAATG